MSIHYQDETLTVHLGDVRDVLAEMPDESVNCVVTSPPYFGLRDYGVEGQLGLESTPAAYVASLVSVFREVRRVLRRDGVLWLNLGDSYANDDKWGGSSGGKHVQALHGNTGIGRTRQHTGLKAKDRIGIPHRVVFALQDDGWWWRDEIVWHKPNAMPSSVEDRTTAAHEFLFMLTRSRRYAYDHEAIREPAVSGPSDLRKMAESRERIGGITKEQVDPMLAASGATNIGRKRSVGGRPLVRSRGDGGREDGFTRMPGGAREWDEHGRPGRNKRSVWTIPTQPYPGAHFATFPEKLVEPCVLAGSQPGGVVLDPFGGSGTVALVANRLGRKAIHIDLNPDYMAQALVRVRASWEISA